MAVVSALPEPNEGDRHGPRGEPELRLGPETLARISAVAAQPGQAWRSEPLARKKAFARRRGEPVAKDAAAPDVDAALERIFQNADFLAGAWLSTGATKADAVAKINTTSELGTGFLVSPWLLMTNNHVIDSPETASGSVAWFRYVEDADGNITPRKVALQPERCFVTSPRDALDYTVVAVAPLDGQPPGQQFGSIPLHGGVGKIVVGQNVNVIQHPSGRTREICVRNNLLLEVVDDTFVLYGADTEPGSSGSPVLSDTWELVALHHASEQKRNAQNQYVDAEGNLATDETPESKRVWVANKGIRVSALVADLRARTLDESNGTEAKDLVGQMLGLGGNI
ncbi:MULTISPECIES: trypsin-like serine peptidase [unclassified Phycicoccus]|uniref:trypsin-like serine peptidase n=1 Tax=unclassified Phycicoccus TaxID=2637926 RepID=UPI0007037C0C|nr:MULTISPECIES: serine protease [unclassified Phycicoccus]KQU68786.1 hypothetical protein ASC58_08840 [Phycicoccus sp. Root101]KQZ88277.1 hypothetical protein ASD62_01990 [Phycicoccus sp. Root563]